MAILYFVKQKRFVGQGRLESPSLLCFMNQLRGERRLRKSKKKEKNTHTQQKLTQFAPRMYESLFLYLILVHLGPVKGIPHRKSIKRVNQQSDVEFVPPADE